MVQDSERSRGGPGLTEERRHMLVRIGKPPFTYDYNSRGDTMWDDFVEGGKENWLVNITKIRRNERVVQ